VCAKYVGLHLLQDYGVSNVLEILPMGGDVLSVAKSRVHLHYEMRNLYVN